jgi:hypothetical protein
MCKLHLHTYPSSVWFQAHVEAVVQWPCNIPPPQVCSEQSDTKGVNTLNSDNHGRRCTQTSHLPRRWMYALKCGFTLECTLTVNLQGTTQ